MNTSTARLVRFAISGTIEQERDVLPLLPVWDRVPYLLRLVAKLVKPSGSTPTNHVPPTDQEIEAEIKQQLVNQAIGALQL